MIFIILRIILVVVGGILCRWTRLQDPNHGTRCWSSPGPGLFGVRHQLAGPCKALVFARYANGRLELRGSKVDFLSYSCSTKTDVRSSVLSACGQSPSSPKVSSKGEAVRDLKEVGALLGLPCQGFGDGLSSGPQTNIPLPPRHLLLHHEAIWTGPLLSSAPLRRD